MYNIAQLISISIEGIRMRIANYKLCQYKNIKYNKYI